MWQTDVFWLIGWAIVVSSVGLMLVPWQWHHRFGKKVLPVLIQHMRLYAIGMFAFGAVILYAVFVPLLKGAEYQELRERRVEDNARLMLSVHP